MTRLPKFLWISRDAASRLLAAFPGDGERSTAWSIYAALALLSSKQSRGDHQGIEASRREVATTAGVNVRTLDAYVKRMVTAGLVKVDHRRRGGLNLPNVWSLLEADVSSEMSSLPSEMSSLPLANSVPQGSELNCTQLLEEENQEENQESNNNNPFPQALAVDVAADLADADEWKAFKEEFRPEHPGLSAARLDGS